MEILILIARIIMLILEGVSATSATKIVSENSGASVAQLWSKLPGKYK
jgi:hypothetical protein